MEVFFSETDLPTVSQDQKSRLNAPISTSERCEAVQFLQNILLEPLMNMSIHSVECGPLQASLREANSSLIIKREMTLELWN